MTTNDEDFTTPEQRDKLAKLPLIKSLLLRLVDTTMDMYMDDIDSVSDAYTLYDVDGIIEMLTSMVDVDFDVIDNLQCTWAEHKRLMSIFEMG